MISRPLAACVLKRPFKIIKINEFNHDFICEFIYRNSATIHNILHSTEFIDEFKDEFSHDFTIINSWACMNSDIWFHDIRVLGWVLMIMIPVTKNHSWDMSPGMSFNDHEFGYREIWIHIMNSYEISWAWIHRGHFITCEFIYEFMYMKNDVKSYLTWIMCTKDGFWIAWAVQHWDIVMVLRARPLRACMAGRCD